MPMDHDQIEIMMYYVCQKYAMHFPLFFSYLLFSTLSRESRIQRGAKKRFRLYRIYSTVVPPNIFLSVWIAGSLGHWVMGHE